MTDPIIHVGIADDHEMFRVGLARLLAGSPDLRVVMHGPSAAAVLTGAEARTIDVLLLDVELDGPPARATIATLGRTHPEIAVIVLTMHRDSILRQVLLDAGARDYVTKDVPVEHLIDRIRCSAAAPPPNPPLTSTERGLLTPRECDVLRLVAEAKGNAEIAVELRLAVGTVKRHVYNLYRKLEVGSRIEAVHRARTIGLL